MTGYRIHHTESSVANTYDPIVAALLVTSALTLLWVPFAAFVGLRNTTSRFGGLHHELGGGFVLWVMWLIESAIATNKWPTRTFARAVAEDKKQGNILITIVAFGWLAFSVLSIVKVFLAMHYAHVAAGAPAAVTSGKSDVREKPAIAPVNV